MQKFSSDGRSLAGLGSPGSSNGQIFTPWGIAVGSAASVFVADYDLHRVQKFSSDGRFLLEWGSAGTGDGQFIGPKRVAVDGSGNVYVSEGAPLGYTNHRVQKFSSDGRFLGQWGNTFAYGVAKNGQFEFPMGMAVDGFGNLYVADSGNNRVQKFAVR